jgi:alcohol dehydrogenase, propanol-preferring
MTKEMLEVVAKHNIKVQTNPFVGLKKIPELVEFAQSGKMKGKGIIIVDESQV